MTGSRAGTLAAITLVLMGARCIAAQSAPAAGPAAAEPWALYDVSDSGVEVRQPVCGPLAYFSGPPLQFDYSGFFHFLTTNYGPRTVSYKTQTDLVGTVQGRQVHEVMQTVQLHPPEEAPTPPGPMSARRVLVQRSAGQYCMIFQASNWNGRLAGLDPMTLAQVPGGTLLFSHDGSSGNCGCYESEVWAFDHGIPYHLDFYVLIAPILKRLLPRGDEVRNGDPLDLTTLTYEHDVSTPSDSEHEGSGGTIRIRFALRGHTLSVADAQFTPPLAAGPAPTLR
ncbi:MAG TPA: hypothetical protein VN690_10630 [Terriglobales bacterium]|nr:hypothetical protein [Terriglobales bacterium]